MQAVLPAEQRLASRGSPVSIGSVDLVAEGCPSPFSLVEAASTPSIKFSPRLRLRSLAPTSPSCYICTDLAESQGFDVDSISPLLATATRCMSLSDSSMSIGSDDGNAAGNTNKVWYLVNLSLVALRLVLRDIC